MTKKEIGYFGEVAAQKYLIRKGYNILATNWHYHHREIDIIAWYEERVIAIEVKTRKQFDIPSQTILKAAQVTRLRLALAAYCRFYGLDYQKSRLDLITVRLKDRQTLVIKQHQDI